MFILPKLNYSYDALEPYIDAKTMEIHHSKHHEGYVQNLNKAIIANGIDEDIKIEELFTKLDKYPDFLRNNAGGHYNHAFFWESLNNQMSQSGEELGAAINETFGGMDGFGKSLAETAMKLFGSGWTWLMVDEDKKLKIVNTSGQNNPLMIVEEKENRGTPIVCIDMWEHAYYLKYQNRKKEYITAFLNIIDWQKASDRYVEALK